MSRFLLVSTDSDFTERVGRATSAGLSGALRVAATRDLPETPAELLSGADGVGERPAVVILGPDLPVDAALMLWLRATGRLSLERSAAR